jgi:hypothetical protein
VAMKGSKIMMTELKIMAMESNILMTDSKILSVSFRAQRRGDVEPPSEAECAMASPRAVLSARR